MKVLKTFLVVSFLIIASLCFSQNTETNKLQTKLKYAKNYIDTIDVFREMGQYYSNIDFEKYIKITDEILNLSIKRKYPKGIAIANNSKGILLYKTGKYDEALKFHLKALNICNLFNITDIAAVVYNNIGNIYSYSKGDYAKAIEYFQKGIEYAKKTKNSKLTLIILYGNIGIAYDRMEKYDDAMFYYSKAFEADKDIANHEINELLGNHYQLLNNYTKALECYSKALNFYEKTQNDFFKCIVLIYIGDLYLKKKMYDTAINYYNKALPIAIEQKSDPNLILIYKSLASIYLSTNNFQKAITYSQKSYDISKRINEMPTYCESAKLLSLSYEKSNNLFEAFKYKKEYIEVYEKLYNQRMTKHFNSVMSDIKLEKKEQEFQIEKQKNQIKTLKLEKQSKFRLFMLLNVLIILLILGVFSSIIYFKQRIKLKNSQLKQLETQSLKEKLQKDMEVQQKEIEKLALYIIEKNKFLETLKEQISAVKKKSSIEGKTKGLSGIYSFISQNFNLTKERIEFQMHVDSLHRDFYSKISKEFSDLTENEKRLSVLIKLNFSNKEISNIMNIAQRSVIVSRYRLRKKLNIPETMELNEFLSKI
ncbi:MAG: tetratricopeptide repeat protein [Bacteroidales bacterium]|nr:tetratricopeptide repeat protein [Bacteroidales bacterium]